MIRWLLSGTGLLLWGISLGQCSQKGTLDQTFGGNYSTGPYGPGLPAGTTPYSFDSSGLIPSGFYGIRKHTSGMNGWVDGHDDSRQDGYMMLVNTDGSSGIFYTQRVSGLCGFANNYICMALSNLSHGGSPQDYPVITAEIRDTLGNLLYRFSSQPLTTYDSIHWNYFYQTFQLPRGVSTIDLVLKHNLVSGNGNDFALDNLNVGTLISKSTLDGFYVYANGKYTYPVYFCPGTPVTIVPDLAGIDTSGKEMQWETGATAYNFSPIPGTSSPILHFDSVENSDSKFYKLVIADSGNLNSSYCRVESVPIGLSIDPHAKIINPGPFCEGQVLQLSVDQGLHFQWSGPGGFHATSKNLLFSHALLSDSGLYSVLVDFGIYCRKPATDTTRVQIFPNPIRFTWGGDTTLCRQEPIRLDVSNPGASYSWNTGDTSAWILAGNAGFFQVQVALEGCTRSDSFRVRYLSAPALSMSPDTTVCNDEPFLLQPGIRGADHLQWNTGSQGPAIQVTRSGTYSLTASNACGLVSGSTRVLLRSCANRIILPTAFTPNHDGLNDVFRPFLPARVEHYQIEVFDRWGKLVFVSRNLQQGWNGTTDGRNCPQGTYVWSARYTTGEGQQQVESGTVILIR